MDEEEKAPAPLDPTISFRIDLIEPSLLDAMEEEERALESLTEYAYFESAHSTDFDVNRPFQPTDNEDERQPKSTHSVPHSSVAAPLVTTPNLQDVNDSSSDESIYSYNRDALRTVINDTIETGNMPPTRFSNQTLTLEGTRRLDCLKLGFIK